MKVFECKTCGQCCHGEGGIVVGEEEIRRMAYFLGISPSSFRHRFCEVRHGRTFIRTGPGGSCLFYHPQRQCLVHPVKPKRCALWPFYPANLKDPESWEIAKAACPGINPQCTHEQFVREGSRALSEDADATSDA